MVSDEAVRMSGDKLFHAVGPATQNARLPRVDVAWYEARRGLHGLTDERTRVRVWVKIRIRGLI